jgi:hypothetical protein
MVATGGSRADGTVNLSYEYGMFQKPIVNTQLAQVNAAQKCQAWGYTDAQAFGGGLRQCEERNEYGCIRTLVTVTYQCTGAGAPH